LIRSYKLGCSSLHVSVHLLGTVEPRYSIIQTINAEKFTLSRITYRESINIVSMRHRLNRTKIITAHYRDHTFYRDSLYRYSYTLLNFFYCGKQFLKVTIEHFGHHFKTNKVGLSTKQQEVLACSNQAPFSVIQFFSGRQSFYPHQRQLQNTSIIS